MFAFAVFWLSLETGESVCLSDDCVLDITKSGRSAWSLAGFPMADLLITDLQGSGHMDW